VTGDVEDQDHDAERAWWRLLGHIGECLARTHLLVEEANYLQLSGQLSPVERALLDQIHAGHAELARTLKEGLQDD
jgi:hypothetical protein